MTRLTLSTAVFTGFFSIAALMFAVAAEAGGELTDAPYWSDGRKALQERLAVEGKRTKAKNVILFLGDGMGVSTVTAARIYDGQLRGETGEENRLSFERFPYTALVKTYNTNQQVADSAGTASAINTGVKTKAGVLGISHLAARGACKDALRYRVHLLSEILEAQGKATGIVTTARLTHATPAAVYAHSADREWETDADLPVQARKDGCFDIARQFVSFAAGDGIDVAMGGGRRSFLGAGRGGRRLMPDDDLVAEWRFMHPDGVYLTTGTDLSEVAEDLPRKVLGLFSDSHMQYMLDRGPDTSEPTLSEMVAVAIKVLEKYPNGYYLMVEGGRIDHGHHMGKAGYALAETQEFARAVGVALTLVDATETLIVVTADHSHTMTIGGYPTRGNDILGLVHANDATGAAMEQSAVAADGKPYAVLGYHNGPGYVTSERGPPERGPTALQQAVIPTRYHTPGGAHAPLSETHGGEDVPLYAVGPWSHLFGGVIEQNVIFHIMTHAMGPDR